MKARHTGECLLAAVVADPESDDPRLAYADWLDENGESERAEIIRIQFALRDQRHGRPEASSENDREQDRLEARERELLDDEQRRLHEFCDCPGEHARKICPLCNNSRNLFVRRTTHADVRRKVWWERGFPHRIRCDPCDYFVVSPSLSLPRWYNGALNDDASRRAQMEVWYGRDYDGAFRASLTANGSKVSISSWARAVATHSTITQFRLNGFWPQRYGGEDRYSLRDGIPEVVYGWRSSNNNSPWDLPAVLWDEVSRQPGVILNGSWADFETYKDAEAALDRVAGEVALRAAVDGFF